MFQVSRVVQVCVRRQLWRTVSPRVPAAVPVGRGGSVAGSVRGLIRQLSSRGRAGVQSCTVDPDQEEQFVFLDCTGETETETRDSNRFRHWFRDQDWDWGPIRVNSQQG